MAIPEFADERAIPYFHMGLVGKTHGENGSAYKQFWDSSSELTPSKMIACNYGMYCAYCGNRGLPLQSRLRSHGDYNTYGYTCICKDSFDAREIEAAAKQLLEDAEDAAYELRETLPKTSPKVVKMLLDMKHKEFVKAQERRGTHDCDLKEMGLEVVSGKIDLNF